MAASKEAPDPDFEGLFQVSLGVQHNLQNKKEMERSSKLKIALSWS